MSKLDAFYEKQQQGLLDRRDEISQSHSKTMEVIRARRKEVVERLRRGLEVLSSDTLMNDYSASDIAYNLRMFRDLAESFARDVWAPAVGLPTNLACVCPRCKEILLYAPGFSDMFTHCAYIWSPQRKHKPLPDDFWVKHQPGGTFKGFITYDEEAEIKESGGF